MYSYICLPGHLFSCARQSLSCGEFRGCDTSFSLNTATNCTPFSERIVFGIPYGSIRWLSKTAVTYGDVALDMGTAQASFLQRSVITETIWLLFFTFGKGGKGLMAISWRGPVVGKSLVL